MEIRQSIFGEVALHSGGQVTGADVGALVRRLLLFDRVIVKSVQLREISSLVKAFGTTGFLQLLDSGILQITCQFSVIILDIAQNGVRHLPLCHFSFGVATLGEQEKILRRGLISLQGISGLQNAHRERLEQAIINGLLKPPDDYGSRIQEQIESDLRNNNPAVRAAIADQLKLLVGMDGARLAIRVEETQPRVFRVVTNLTDEFGMPEKKTHEILHNSIAAVANLDQRLEDMAAYSAITGFKESEAPVLFGKLAGLIAPQNPRTPEEQFTRVVQIANLPDFVPGQRIDVEKLLKARDSEDCREFRSWLLRIRDVPDGQIRDMVRGVRNTLGSFVRSDVGKVLRLAITTAAGFIPPFGLPGVATGTIDSFLVERVLPTSGAVAFLAKTYPSLFVSP